jgi:hypothetical protein
MAVIADKGMNTTIMVIMYANNDVKELILFLFCRFKKMPLDEVQFERLSLTLV